MFEASSRTAGSSFTDLGSSPEVRVGPRDTIILASVGTSDADIEVSDIFDGDDADGRVYANSESVQLKFTYDPNEIR